LPNEVVTHRYRAYLFDLDGTLIDSAPDITAAVNAALASIALPSIDERTVRDWIGHGSSVLLERALDHHGEARRAADTREIENLLTVFFDHYRQHIADASRPYPGVDDALSRLQARGAGLAVVTNKIADLSHRVLRALTLHHYFNVIVGGDSLPQRKPDAAPALQACRLLGVAPREALFVGDSLTDVMTARNAGCPVVCVRDGYNHGTPADSLGADAVIDSLTELT